MDPIKRGILNELRFIFKDCEDNLDLILKMSNREEILTKDQLKDRLDDILDEVADILTEHVYEIIDEYTLEYINEIVDILLIE